MNTETTDSIPRRIHPNEMDSAPLLLTEIRFDCMVKIFDALYRTHKASILNPSPKAPPPQYFALEHKLTLEFIKHGDPYQIGVAVKSAYQKLADHIDLVRRQHQ